MSTTMNSHFLVAVVIFMITLTFSTALDWKNCDKRTPIQVKKLRVHPTPIIVREGEVIAFSGTVISTKAVGDTYKLKTTVVKGPDSWFPFTLPCYGSFGTCEYEDLKCEQMMPFLNVPTCPPPVGTYKLKERTMEIPEVSLPSFLTNGDYSIKAEVFDQSTNKLLACAVVKVTATSK